MEGGSPGWGDVVGIRASDGQAVTAWRESLWEKRMDAGSQGVLQGVGHWWKQRVFWKSGFLVGV